MLSCMKSEGFELMAFIESIGKTLTLRLPVLRKGLHLMQLLIIVRVCGFV